jgi:4a-hydroxytetrahydrobiopterin dehydratase
MDVDHALSLLGSGWHVLEGARLRNTYTFNTYLEGVAFVQKVAFEAERLNHHPDIVLRWGEVQIETYTHTTGGLTSLDFALATAVQDCFTHTMVKKTQG